jgi:MFS family permease
MIGKFGIAASFAVFYVFVGELLPTVLRSQAMGIASFIAGIGLLGFPYIVYLVSVYFRDSHIIFAKPCGYMRIMQWFQRCMMDFMTVSVK